MPETILDSVLRGKVSLDDVIKWLNNNSDEDTPEELFCCSRTEFVEYFLSFLRSQTDSILKPKGNSTNQNQTPDKLIPNRDHKRSTSEPTKQDGGLSKNDRLRNESPNRHNSFNKRPIRKVKTKLFHETSKDSNQSTSKSDLDESKSTSIDSAVSSTPLKNGVRITDYPPNVTSPLTPQSGLKQGFSYERCDTPRIGHRYKNQDKSVSLGDYFANAQMTKSTQKKKKPSKIMPIENDTKNLDLSNSELFPEIGKKKEKRRIKPTNIGQKTESIHSINSFNSDQFQQPSPLVENSAFKQQKDQPMENALSFNVERNILKKERHKLMEKFNILNTNSANLPTVSIQSKINLKNIVQERNYVKIDPSVIIYKEKLDILTTIYYEMFKNNFIISLGSELYFLMSILSSKQLEEEYKKIEEHINLENIQKYILKSINNCIYFAVKSIYNLRHILDVLFDKNTLKLLGDQKDVRAFMPELAKYLLNAYSLKCEQDSAIQQDVKEKGTGILDRSANGMVCFNVETDNSENFPSMLSFQNFRKQRDMFYEILRCYNDTQQTNSAKTAFRSRIKTLMNVSVAAANYSHLVRLFVTHMMSECLSTAEDTKLHKLQRRLTGAAQSSHRLPYFTQTEMFYKEFLLFAENECFRVHLKECLISEICALDATALTNVDESTTDMAKEYLQTCKKLQLLSKFLGYLTDLPFTQIPIDYSLKTGLCMYSQREIVYAAPKDKVALNEIALRNHSQPSIDLKGILTDATEKERLCISLPWIVQYIATLSYTTLRLKYYKDVIEYIFDIYINILRDNARENIKSNIKIFLKFNLGWLFDIPNFPQELLYERNKNKMMDNVKKITDTSDVLKPDSIIDIDDSIIIELCPFLKDICCLLTSSKPVIDNKEGSYRHITPLSLTNFNSEEKIKSKELEIQKRLEQALIKSQSASTRRVLELVTERVSSSTAQGLAVMLGERRAQCRLLAAEQRGHTLDSLTQLYVHQLHLLRKDALIISQKRIAASVKGALAALLSHSAKQPQPLEALVIRHCSENIAKWINNNWSGIEVLCKDIQDELKNLQILGDNYTQTDKCSNTNVELLVAGGKEEFEKAHVSPSSVIIELKEYICILLDDDIPTIDINKLLTDSLSVCSATNVFTLPCLRNVICSMVCDLCVVLVSKKPNDFNEDFLNKVYLIFDVCCPERQKVTKHDQTIDQTTDLSVSQIKLTDISTVSLEIERDFGPDERMPTPISDEEDNSSRNVMTDKLTRKPKEIDNLDDSLKSPEINSDNKDYYLEKDCYKTPKKISNFENPSILQSNYKNIENTPNSSILNVSTRYEDNQTDTNIDYFNRILCPRNIVVLSRGKSDSKVVWGAMAEYLIFLLKNAFINEESLTEQCLAVYRQDWPQNILENLSTCMKTVSTKWRTKDGGKFNLFLDFLSEFCNTMDFDSFDFD